MIYMVHGEMNKSLLVQWGGVNKKEVIGVDIQVKPPKKKKSSPYLLIRAQTVDKVPHFCAGFFYAKCRKLQCLCGFRCTFLV